MNTEQRRRILIVEDDAHIAEAVRDSLALAGYHAAWVETGGMALSEIAVTAPDLIVLDMILPDMNGLKVLRKLRLQSSLPLIVLSGLREERDKVRALEAGADDYVAKPFSPEELVARVRALLRRAEKWTPQSQAVLGVGELELDMSLRQVAIRGRKLHLTATEYGLLITLMQSAGRTISYNALLRAVWGREYEGDYGVLRVNISRLRHKIEKDPRNPDYIITVQERGYRMPIRVAENV